MVNVSLSQVLSKSTLWGGHVSKSTFPIIDVKENKLISIDGNTSSFYKINNPDLEQMTHNEKESFFDSVSSGLNYLETDKYFKFYNLVMNPF